MLAAPGFTRKRTPGPAGPEPHGRPARAARRPGRTAFGWRRGPSRYGDGWRAPGRLLHARRGCGSPREVCSARGAGEPGRRPPEARGSSDAIGARAPDAGAGQTARGRVQSSVPASGLACGRLRRATRPASAGLVASPWRCPAAPASPSPLCGSAVGRRARRERLAGALTCPGGGRRDPRFRPAHRAPRRPASRTDARRAGAGRRRRAAHLLRASRTWPADSDLGGLARSL